jgi:putative DNA primase/helicase
MEQLAGKWIIEVGELSVMRRSEVEHVKTFLSKQEDAYRPSYGRRLESFPRQCIFGGTTNRDDFLQDSTGNRRFWPVIVRDATRMWAELTPEIVDQLWAEADICYTLGEDLYLTGEAALEATESQDRFMELGGKLGVADEFLNKLIPDDWEGLSITEKLDWLKGYGFDEQESGTKERTEISGLELFVECFKGRVEEYQKRDAHEMTDIMFKLGWEKTAKRKRIKDYGLQRVFTKIRKSDKSDKD